MDANILLKFCLKNDDYIKINLLKSKNNSIYTGKSGLIVYLLELYSITKDETVLNEIRNAANLISKEINKNTSYAFFTGNIGVAYCLIKVYKITKDKTYLKTAISIAKENKKHFALTPNPINDLLNGVSGILLGLLLIYSEGYSDEWIIDDIKFYINYLLTKSHLSENGGIYWDITNRINKGLTGFSHGASGIGFVFNELYRLTKNDEFKFIFESTIKYEDQFFDRDIKNWLDFRKFPYKKEDDIIFERNARRENLDFFIEKKHMFAWCHGAPGIIGVRNKIEKEIIETSISSIYASKNHSLCHSGTGNILCLIENKSIKSEVYIVALEEKCQELILHFEKNKNFLNGYSDPSIKDFSLFMGELGPLYFLLKAYKFLSGIDKNSNSILFPKVNETGKLELVNQKILELILKSNFPKTLYFLKKKFPNFIIEKSDLKIDYFEKRILLLNDEIINDVFHYESTMNRMKNSINSFSYEFFKNNIDQDFFKSQLGKKSLKLIRIKIDKNIKIIETKWDWDSFTNLKWTLNEYKNRNSFFYAIVPNFEKMHVPLNKVQLLAVEFLKKEHFQIEDLINYFSNLIEGSQENKQLVEEHITNIVFFLVKNRVAEIEYEKF